MKKIIFAVSLLALLFPQAAGAELRTYPKPFSKNEIEWLKESQEDLEEMRMLTRKGMTLIKAEKIKNVPKNIARKFVFTEWLQQGVLKWGFVGSLCTYQSLNGVIDGYHFRQGQDTYLINSGNYHVFVTGQRLAGISTGWFGYANYRNKQQTKMGKVCRLIGSSMIARNAFEWSYKITRYGTPWDYRECHNERAIVYFGFRNGKFCDLYIGTGELSGPIVDLGFLLGGLILLR